MFYIFWRHVKPATTYNSAFYVSFKTCQSILQEISWKTGEYFTRHLIQQLFHFSFTMDTTIPRVILSIALAALLPMASPNNQDPVAKENIPHSRQKRILWITNDGRLALPPGTTMTITPSLSMPFVRHPPKGFLSNVSVSFPFTSKFTLSF